MPHAWWHQWGEPETLMQRRERERLELEQLAQERMMLGTQVEPPVPQVPVPQVPVPNVPKDPSVWQQYLVDPIMDAGSAIASSAPAQFLWDRDPESRFFPGLQTELQKPAIQKPLQAMESISERVIRPYIGEVTAPLAGTWGDEGLQFNPDAFQKYVDPEFPLSGKEISPMGILESLPPVSFARGFVAPFEEGFNREIFPRADTIREQRVSEAARIKEEETGVAPTQKERRQIRQDLYKLPPGVLGLTEEAPWAVLPAARTVRTASEAARAGQALSTGGKLGRAAPVVRGSLEVGEELLSPLEFAEESMAKLITAPLKLTGKGIAKGLSPVNARLTERRLNQTANQVNDMIDEPRDEGLPPYTPEQALEATNAMVFKHLGIEEKLFKIENGRVVRDKSVKMPRNVIQNYQPTANAQREYERMFPKLTENEINQRNRVPKDTGPHVWEEPDASPAGPVPTTTAAAVPERPAGQVFYRGTKGGVGQMERGLVDSDALPFGEGVLHITPNQRIARSFGEDVEEYVLDVDANQVWDMDAPLSSIENKNLIYTLVAETGATPTGMDLNRTPLLQDWSDEAFDEAFDSLGELYYRHVQGEYGSYADTNEILLNAGVKIIKATDPMEEVGVLDDSVLRRIDEPTPGSMVPDDIEVQYREPLYQGTTGDPSRASKRDMQAAQVEARRSETPTGQTHQVIEDVARRLAPSGRNVDELLGGAEQVVKEIQGLEPGAADFYVKLMFSLHDSTFALRVLQDNYFRSINPAAAFKPGSHRDVVAGIILSGGAPIRGMRFYETFMRETIEPLLGNGVEQWHMERYLQAKHWVDIETNIGRTNMPNVYDPRTKSYVSSDGWQSWIDELEQGLTPEQFERVVKGAEETRDLYQYMRNQLFQEGIFSKEQFDTLTNQYPWYNPIDYEDYLDSNSVSRSMPIITKGLYALSDDVAVMNQLPPLGETLARRLISHELRIHRNRVNKAFVDMAIRSRVGFVDVTPEWDEVVAFKKYIDKEGNSQEFPVFKDSSSLYDDKLKTGYMTFFEDGERKIYGQLDSRGRSGFVDKIWWDAVNGRAGLGVHGGMELENIFALSNSFFKSTYTTWDPLFMIGNGLIDQLVVGLKYRVMPTTVWYRLATSIARNLPGISGREGTQALDIKAFLRGDIKGGFVLGGEDRFRELMQLKGGYQNAFFTSQQIARTMQREIRDAGHLEAQVIDGSKKKLLRDKLADGARKYFPVPVVGEYVEQAPRLLVGEKTLKRLLNERYGKGEWKRLMKLSREDWKEELYNNYNKTGKGLIDTPEAGQAAVNTLDATINFFRGGDAVRRMNNYFMFLNAAFEGAKVPFRMLGVDVHLNIKPVEDARSGRQIFEFGEWRDQLGKRRGVTGKYDAPLGTILGKQVDNRIVTAATVASAVSAYSALHLAWNFQHEEYWDIPTYVRYNGLVIMQPAETDEDGNKIIDPLTGRPKPNYIVTPHRVRELNLFFGSTTYLLEKAFTDHPVEWTKYAKEIWKSSSPINDLPLPQLASVGLEETLAYDFYRQEPIVNSDYDHLPVEEQYNQYTSEASRIISGRLGDMPWAPDIVKSPMRLEHLYENIGGGIGRRLSDGTDATILLLEDLWKNAQDKSLADKVKDFRQMSRTERREFRTSLTAEENEQFEKELRKPFLESKGDGLKSVLEAAWATTGIEQRFGPDRGGGLREISVARTEAATGLSADQTGDAASKLRLVKRELLTRQQSDDSKLDNWATKKSGETMTPQEWRDSRKDKWKIYEGAELLAGYIFPKAVQGQDRELKQQWYDSIYNAAGAMPDYRSKADLLIAGYYNITSPEDDPTRTWSEYFDDRDAYVESIRQRASAAGDPQLIDEFEAALQANLTPTEKSYTESMKYLSSYWDIGSTLDTLIENGTQRYPELAKLWDDYLNGDAATRERLSNSPWYTYIGGKNGLIKQRAFMRRKFVETDYIEKLKAGIELPARMDELLVYWYGNFYEPVTPQGKSTKQLLYGGLAR